MKKKPCKECPWVVRNNHNDSIINHSKRLSKKHNCHMISRDKSGGLWNVKKECQCVGNRMFLEGHLDD
jgi:hypothetical protein